MAATKDWKSLAADKRTSNLAKIPSSWRLPADILQSIDEASDQNVLDIPRSSGLLTQKELEITETADAFALVEQLAKGELKAYDVTQAFCKRAAIADQLTHCLTEIFFEEALHRAKVLDEYYAREKVPMGPLHGLPISLKDSFNVKGVHTTCGYISFLDRPPVRNNSAVVEILLNLGAVLYVKTNIPQTFMTADSSNNVFGRTLNPYRLSLTAGGSSGGEAALIALRGSPLGIGTDIAGSVRIPALCNGLVGFKPCVGRLPFGGGTAPSRVGSPSSIFPVIGPIARSVRDCELLVRSVCEADPWLYDETTLGAPWRELGASGTETGSQRKLRLGLITEEKVLPLHPPVLRTLRTAVEKLEAAGHVVVPLDERIPSLLETAKLAWLYFNLDPAKTALKFIKDGGEPIIPSLLATRFPEQDDWEPSLDKLWGMNVKRSKILRTYKKLVVENNLDLILMPGFYSTAVPHDTYGTTPYTVLANVLNYPAAVLPFLAAEKALDEPFNRDGVEYVQPYRPEGIEGMPSSIQLLGRPMHDEELMRDLEVVEKVLKT